MIFREWFLARRIYAVFWLLITCVALTPLGTAYGQAQTTLSVSPESETLYLNAVNTIELELQVTNAVTLQGFELTLTYDPEVVRLDSWSHGGMLDPVSVVVKTITPGFFRLGAVQLSGTPPSGDGVLLRLTFSGVGVGTSAIQITEAEFTNGTPGGVTSPATQNGMLTAAYDPALLDQFPLTGEVSLQGQTQRAGAPVSLGLGATYRIGPYTTVSLEQDGANLDFGSVVGDTYVITTSQPRYLNLTASQAKTVTVSAEKTAINPLWLVAGNAVWTDNVIDAADASLVGASFGMTEADLLPGDTLDADLNFDGVVNLRDLALVAGNYDLTSAQVYQDWLP